MDGFSKTVFSVATAIIGVAIVAVLVSKNSKTVDVIKAAGDAFNGALKTAVSPIAVNG